MNINVKIRNKQYILSTKLSNNNIARIDFCRDGMVADKYNPYFAGEGYNWWVRAYIGPRWKRLFVTDESNSGTTEKPMEGLIALKKLLTYFIDNYMSEKDLIEISGSTMQRDVIYNKFLSELGFRFVEWYEDSYNIMIYVKDPGNDEYIMHPDGSMIINPNNPWGALRIYGIDFPEKPNYNESDYEYKHHTLLFDMITYPFIRAREYISQWYIHITCGFEYLWSNIKIFFKKLKIKKHRKSSV